MDIDIEEIKEIARIAGKKVLEYYNTNYDISYKTADKSSPLTEADLASEKIIKGKLERYGFPILSEESADDGARLNSGYIWIIDPLDGTSDFVEKTGEFAVHIGLAEKGQPVLGVVYEPSANRFYFAQAGQGAFREEQNQIKKIQASAENEFKKMRILVSRNHLLEKEVKLGEKLGLIKTTCGSAGIKISRVAEGSAHIYLNSSGKSAEWDTCAGNIILREAGGKITDQNGKEIKYNNQNPKHRDGYLATNGTRHEDIIRELEKINSK